MLELVDLGKNISKQQYQEVFADLEARMGACQRAARAAGVPVQIVFEGWDAAGKGTLINRLTQALDPRGFKVHSILAPNEVERFYPWMRRFWLALPAAGQFTIFDHSWCGRALLARMEKSISPAELQRTYEEIRQFERQLADAGTVLIKFWLHIDRHEQKKRFKRLEADPATAWKVGKAEWKRHRQYGRWLEAIEEMLAETASEHAPWTIVEATQKRFARVKVFQTVLGRVESELSRRAPPRNDAADPDKVGHVSSVVGHVSNVPATARLAESVPHDILDQVDLGLALSREVYETELKRLQTRLFRLEHKLYLARIPAVIVYEGWDAAGKGGNIKRLTWGLDPRGYEVVPVAAPSDQEKAHHWLWRFWRDLPKAGHITIFDRSWYGRVLVERVEGFCTEDEWRRAYREINEFERQLADFGTAIVKFWLHIDPDEQLRRFQSRQQDASRQWKITDEDWRNRQKWDQYQAAVVEMLQQTSTPHAPWTVLEANCKLYARIKALRTVAEVLEKALERP